MNCEIKKAPFDPNLTGTITKADAAMIMYHAEKYYFMDGGKLLLEIDRPGFLTLNPGKAIDSSYALVTSPVFGFRYIYFMNENDVTKGPDGWVTGINEDKVESEVAELLNALDIDMTDKLRFYLIQVPYGNAYRRHGITLFAMNDGANQPQGCPGR